MASRPLNSLRTLAQVALCGAAACGLLACGDSRPTPAPLEHPVPKESLLSRAIRALGGREILESIKTLTLRSELHERGRVIEVGVHISLPDRYRHDVHTGDAHLVHATDGQKAWATLDDVAVPLELDEVQRFREQMTLVQLSLLVGLEGRESVKIVEKGARDGLDWLEIQFKDADAGPYLLGFDPGTALLTRAEWRTRLHGQRGEVAVTLSVRDYRQVAGIMVPYAATFLSGDQLVAEDRVVEVVINPPVAGALFLQPAPAAETPIQRRTMPGGQIVLLGPIKGRPDDAERVLVAWLKEHDIDRNGPMFHVVDNGIPVAIGVPVHLPPTRREPLPAAAEGAPAVTLQPAQEVLSTIVTPRQEALLVAAEKRLLLHAESLSLAVAGPIRRVAWNEDIAQVQLPIRARTR